MYRMTVLPKDPHYPSDLTKLGYFVNEIDEIRHIDNPTWYFKYFITKEPRHNTRHREAFDTAVREIIYDRLGHIGMIKYLCSENKVEWESPDLKKRNADPDTAVPHIPIYASKNVGTSPRVIVLVGESFQDLGIFAQRIIGMKGGINQGSVIEFIRHINSLEIDATTGAPLPENATTSMAVKTENPEEIELVDTDTDAPGIILANTGQLRWCRSLGKAINSVSWEALTRPSAVADPIHWHPIRNSVAGHRDISQHLDQIFTTVIPKLCGRDTKLDIIALGDSCEFVPLSLDKNWSVIAPRMQSMALVNLDYAEPQMYKNEIFKTFLLQRTRGFMKDSTMPANSPMFGPNDGLNTRRQGFGYNMYSIPDEVADESIFPNHFPTVLEWQAKVAGDKEYCENELTEVTFIDDKEKPSEVDGDIKFVHEQGMPGADVWGMPEGLDEMSRREDDLTAAKNAMAQGISIEEYRAAEMAKIKKEMDDEFMGEFKEITTEKPAPPAADREVSVAEAEELRDFTVQEPADKGPSLSEQQGYEWHQSRDSDFKFKWLTKEEQGEREKAEREAAKEKLGEKERQKKARAARLEKLAKKAALNAMAEGRTVEMAVEGAALPPTVDDKTEICSKTSVEDAAKELVEDMKTLDIAAHTALPFTPQAEEKKDLKVVNATPLDELSDDEEKNSARSTDPASAVSTTKKPRLLEDNLLSMNLEPGPGSAAERLRNNYAQFLKDTKGQRGALFSEYRPTEHATTTSLSSAIFSPSAPPNTNIQSFDGTNDDEYLACPPERMERLPSVVAQTLHTGNPEVKLSKDEKAAILQTTVLSSPVKADAENGEDRKISVVSLEN